MFYNRAKALNLGIATCLSLITCSALPVINDTNQVLAEQTNKVDINYYIQQFKNPQKRLQAIEALARFRKLAVPALVEALKDKDYGVRFSAVFTLNIIGWEAKAAVPALIMALKDEKELVRYYAAETLGKIGADASDALPALITASKDKVAWVRVNAVEALVNLRQEPKLILPVLIEALQDEDGTVRIFAAEGLGKIGKAAKPATAALNRLLTNKYIGVAVEAAEALAKIGEANKASVNVLVSVLQNYKENSLLRSRASWALGISGQVAVSSIPNLTEALRDKDVFIWSSAANSLLKISQSFQPNLNQLSTQQLNKIISGLEQVLKISGYEKFILSAQDINVTLEAMKKERLRRQSL